MTIKGGYYWQTFKVMILVWLYFSVFITKIHLFKYIENFTSKNWKFSDNFAIFYISAQNIDCGTR